MITFLITLTCLRQRAYRFCSMFEDLSTLYVNTFLRASDLRFRISTSYFRRSTSWRLMAISSGMVANVRSDGEKGEYAVRARAGPKHRSRGRGGPAIAIIWNICKLRTVSPRGAHGTIERRFSPFGRFD